MQMAYGYDDGSTNLSGLFSGADMRGGDPQMIEMINLFVYIDVGGPALIPYLLGL